MAKTLDLTSGSISRKLLLFALPLLGASLIQQLYTTVDILFVSNYLGAEASAAVGASVLLNSALVNLFTVGNLDLSKPWWDPYCTEECTFKNAVYQMTGDISIGDNSVIGGNVWLTESLPAGTKITAPVPENKLRFADQK